MSAHATAARNGAAPPARRELRPLPSAVRSPLTPAARRLAMWALAHPARGRVSVTLPDGSIHRGGDPSTGPDVNLIVRSRNLWRRLATRGRLALGESYAAGDWRADDLVGLLEILAVTAELARTSRPGRRAARRASGGDGPRRGRARRARRRRPAHLRPPGRHHRPGGDDARGRRDPRLRGPHRHRPAERGHLPPGAAGGVHGGGLPAPGGGQHHGHGQLHPGGAARHARPPVGAHRRGRQRHRLRRAADGLRLRGHQGVPHQHEREPARGPRGRGHRGEGHGRA